ncbi:hypothetical protein VP01_4537g1 [Puccinia sorghi]|uniref:Uncharacterized protein n=1 Tax=Puccinia sorghi TaxID=27349 RepID=A0A0L6UQX6_9BASI|nr:hypothetical protein VP01_4537g1 [Puccinia sorghi]
MSPWTAANSTSSHFPPDQQPMLDEAVQAQTAHLESMISILANEVRSLKTSTETPTTTSQKKSAAVAHTNNQGSTTKPRANAKIQDKPAKKPVHGQKSTPAPEPPLPAPTVTPKRSNALYIHVKVLWGLLKQDSVPAPDLQTLCEFYERFSSSNQVQQAANVASSPALIDSNEVQLFKTAHAGSVRYGRQIVHVGSNNIRYAQGLMVRLGLRVWCPNLEEDSALLYNAAHRIAAITTFQELVAGNAYTYLNANPKYANNTALVIQAYNHFVHFVLLSKYKKEQKQEGKNAQEAEHKKISKNRERVYKIKTLPYRSNNANKFFRALDLCMLREASLNPATNRKRRIRKLTKKEKIMSTYVNPPKGLPIDFYDPDWYHTLPDSQQKLIPNIEPVAFLPDASKSLQPKAMRHEDEKLSDKSFTCKYWEILVEPYGLLNEDSSNGSGNKESNNHSNNAGTDSEGEGHNLDDPSPDASCYDLVTPFRTCQGFPQLGDYLQPLHLCTIPS